MSKFYITFGQDHAHRINGKTFDCNCVAEVEAKDENEARNIFMPQFCFSYPEEAFDFESLPIYYPRGIIKV